jgi:hypothetical protein
MLRDGTLICAVHFNAETIPEREANEKDIRPSLDITGTGTGACEPRITRHCPSLNLMLTNIVRDCFTGSSTMVSK